MPLVPMKLTEQARAGIPEAMRLDLFDCTALQQLAKLLFGFEPDCHAVRAVGNRNRELTAVTLATRALLNGHTGHCGVASILPSANLHSSIVRATA